MLQRAGRGSRQRLKRSLSPGRVQICARITFCASTRTDDVRVGIVFYPCGSGALTVRAVVPAASLHLATQRHRPFARVLGVLVGSQHLYPPARINDAYCILFERRGLRLRTSAEPRDICSIKPRTGFYRDGCCNTGREDVGIHTICAVMTSAFLEFSKTRGNDLSTPVPASSFPGLNPGDSTKPVTDIPAEQSLLIHRLHDEFDLLARL